MAGKQIIKSSLRRTTDILPKQQCRTFTSTSRKPAQGGGQVRGLIMKNMATQRSMQSRMKTLKRGEIPTDLGLLPNTFIKPDKTKLPLLFSNPKKRLRIEWIALKQKAMDFVAIFYTNYWLAKKDPITRKRPKFSWYLRERYTEVRKLHNQLYTAIAKGDRETIEKIACTGLQRNLNIKLDYRRAAELPPEKWTCEYKGWTPTSGRTPWIFQALCPSFLKSTQIVADRVAPIPIGQQGTLRQVIARVRSRQIVVRDDGQMMKHREGVEYVVIQRMKIDGEEDDWMIWGTVEATNEKEIEELLQKASSTPGFKERIWERFTQMGGDKMSNTM